MIAFLAIERMNPHSHLHDNGYGLGASATCRVMLRRQEESLASAEVLDALPMK